MCAVVNEMHVGLVADHEDAAIGKLLHDALPAAAVTGAPVGLLGLHSTTARVRSVSTGAISSQVRLYDSRSARGASIGYRARRLNGHLMIREVGRRQHDLLAWAHEVVNAVVKAWLAPAVITEIVRVRSRCARAHRGVQRAAPAMTDVPDRLNSSARRRAKRGLAARSADEGGGKNGNACPSEMT